MASNVEDSVRTERDSIAYDDVVSLGDLSKDSVNASENVEEKGDTVQTQKKELSGQNSEANNSVITHGGEDTENKDGSSEVLSKPKVNKTDDQESPKERRKIRKDCDKEQWTPVKSDLNENKESRDCSDSAKSENVMDKDSPDSHPKKPPRRHPQKRASGNLEQKISPNHSPEGDPVKPPRRRLPQTPNSAEPKADLKTPSDGGDVFSVTSDGSEQKAKEIVCKPVLTSSPNQDEIPSLSIETNVLDRSHRVLSLRDESSAGGVRKVESFYDFLYSQEDNDNSVAEATSPILLQKGDRIGSALSGSEDHLYDDVPRDSSIAKSWCSNGTYDEVIVNQGMNSTETNIKLVTTNLRLPPTDKHNFVGIERVHRIRPKVPFAVMPNSPCVSQGNTR